jgi:hypothetical protein
MKKFTYKKHSGYKAIILKLLDENPTTWFKSYELEKVMTPYGWIGTRGTRDCRDLAADELIKVTHERSRYAEYRSVELPKPPVVLPQYAKEVVSQLSLSI